MNFITPAFAQAARGAPGGADFLMQLAPFGIILIIMYFLILRPQQQRAKAQQDMISTIRRGDTVVTTGGLIGKVTKTVDDSESKSKSPRTSGCARLRAAIPKCASRASRSRTAPDGHKYWNSRPI